MSLRDHLLLEWSSVLIGCNSLNSYITFSSSMHLLQHRAHDQLQDCVNYVLSNDAVIKV